MPTNRSSFLRGAMLLLALGAGAAPIAVAEDIALKPTGEYAQIDTRLGQATLQVLIKGSGDERKAAIEQIKAAPDKYAPPVFFALSLVLFQAGNKDEAAFWFYAGQLRGRFDANRCADVSAGQALDELSSQLGKPINQYAFQDRVKLATLVQRVIDWDKSTPHNYDPRWINLSGMDAIQASLDETGATPAAKPLSLPKDQWEAIADKTRADFLAGFQQVLQSLDKQGGSAQ